MLQVQSARIEWDSLNVGPSPTNTSFSSAFDGSYSSDRNGCSVWTSNASSASDNDAAVEARRPSFTPSLPVNYENQTIRGIGQHSPCCAVGNSAQNMDHQTPTSSSIYTTHSSCGSTHQTPQNATWPQGGSSSVGTPSFGTAMSSNSALVDRQLPNPAPSRTPSVSSYVNHSCSYGSGNCRPSFAWGADPFMNNTHHDLTSATVHPDAYLAGRKSSGPRMCVNANAYYASGDANVTNHMAHPPQLPAVSTLPSNDTSDVNMKFDRHDSGYGSYSLPSGREHLYNTASGSINNTCLNAATGSSHSPRNSRSGPSSSHGTRKGSSHHSKHHKK